MPILVTIAAITYLFTRGSKGEASFLAPGALRKKVEKLPEGSAHTESLRAVDRLDALAGEYDSAVDAAVSAYLADVEDWSSSADKLIEEMDPFDKAREDVLFEVIRLRDGIVDAVSPEEWDKLFG